MRIRRAAATLTLAFGALASGCGDGSTGLGSTPYDRADVVRGGISYDLFWNEATGFPQSSALIANFSSRADFFRCKQCHGWDHLGSRGFYVSRGPRTSRPNISSVDLAATLAPIEPENVWAVFRAYLDAVAARTTDEIVPRWKDRLGGADVFTLGNAWEMAESLRLDLNSMGPFGIRP